jgi:hypothetical protein
MLLQLKRKMSLLTRKEVKHCVPDFMDEQNVGSEFEETERKRNNLRKVNEFS